MVYIIDNMGKALMPTERHGKVRRLLRDKMAHVVRLEPFTIQLDYETTAYTQEVSLGVDAGSVHIGISATTTERELFSAEVIERVDVSRNIADRKRFRVTRRNRKIRYRTCRLNNRRIRKGQQPPSIEQKVESHLKIIQLVYNILPVTRTTIEVASFDIQKIKGDKIQGGEYQKGEQTGFWNVREYVLARDNHECQHCHGKSGDKILNVHHLESRRTGGNAPNNLITLCETCHNAYHRGEIELKIKRGTSLRDAAAMNSMRWNLYVAMRKIINNVFLTFGYITKHRRINFDLEKSHRIDAYCIANNMQARLLDHYFIFKCIRKHNRVLHISKPAKGGKRRNAIAGHWIGETGLQVHDTVEWNKIKCFISGRDGIRLLLRDINWNIVTPTKRTNPKCIKFIRRHRGSMIMQIIK